MIIALTVLAIVASLYAAEHFFRKPFKNEDAYAYRLDVIICLLFAIFLLLLGAVIKYAW